MQTNQKFFYIYMLEPEKRKTFLLNNNKMMMVQNTRKIFCGYIFFSANRRSTNLKLPDVYKKRSFCVHLQK